MINIKKLISTPLLSNEEVVFEKVRSNENSYVMIAAVVTFLKNSENEKSDDLKKQISGIVSHVQSELDDHHIKFNEYGTQLLDRTIDDVFAYIQKRTENENIGLIVTGSVGRYDNPIYSGSENPVIWLLTLNFTISQLDDDRTTDESRTNTLALIQIPLSMNGIYPYMGPNTNFPKAMNTLLSDGEN